MKSQYFYRRVARESHISGVIPAMSKGDFSLKEFSKRTGMTYEYLSQCVNDAVAEGILTREKYKNKYVIKLTDKGKVLTLLCEGLKMVIEDNKTIEEVKELVFNIGNTKIETKRLNNDIKEVKNE